MTIPSIICTESLTRHDHYDTHHHHLQQDDHDDQHAQRDYHDDHPQHDLHRKPQGTIALHESCRVSRAEGSNTFEIATNGDHHDNGHDDEVDDDIDYDGDADDDDDDDDDFCVREKLLPHC